MIDKEKVIKMADSVSSTNKNCRTENENISLELAKLYLTGGLVEPISEKQRGYIASVFGIIKNSINLLKDDSGTTLKQTILNDLDLLQGGLSNYQVFVPATVDEIEKTIDSWNEKRFNIDGEYPTEPSDIPELAEALVGKVGKEGKLTQIDSIENDPAKTEYLRSSEGK